MTHKKVAFEWGSKKFSDQEGLCDTLAGGYFCEGNAWGSIRCGWEIVLPWDEVFPLLVSASGSKLEAYPAAALGRDALSRVPYPIKQVHSSMEGSRLWLPIWPAGFVNAAAPMWSLCEAWHIDQSAKSPRTPRIKTVKGKPKAVHAPPPGPRRL